jgi:CRISPR-associated endoribonuclease Cas6
MRIQLTLSKPRYDVPIEYHTKLTGVFHKWIGLNDLHGEISLYSFSSLLGGEEKKNILTFQNNPSWFISAYNPEIIKALINGMQKDSSVCFGMHVLDAVIHKVPDLSFVNRFKVGSPVFIKGKTDKGTKHYTFHDMESGQLMTNALKSKMKKAGLPDEDFEIKFDTNYPKARTTTVKYNGIGNLSSFCPVIIEGSNQVKQFAWTTGVGHSTGIGLGAII